MWEWDLSFKRLEDGWWEVFLEWESEFESVNTFVREYGVFIGLGCKRRIQKGQKGDERPSKGHENMGPDFREEETPRRPQELNNNNNEIWLLDSWAGFGVC